MISQAALLSPISNRKTNITIQQGKSAHGKARMRMELSFVPLGRLDKQSTCWMVFTLWISLILVTPPLPCGATVLGDLAASMQPGTWADLNTNNISQAFGFTIDGASHNILPFSDDMVWDPVHHLAYFMGGDHIYDNASDWPRWVQYTENTNSWQILPRPYWFSPGTMHAYGHSALNPANGDFYHKRSGMNPDFFFKYTYATGTWSVLPTFPDFLGVAGAWEYFPELGGPVWTGRSVAYLFRESTGQWVKLANNLVFGDYSSFAKYNPVYHVMVFGGGANNQRKIYKLDSSGNITPLRDSPVDLYMANLVFTVDPVGGDYLVFTDDMVFRTYNVITDTWQNQTSSVPIWSTKYGGPAGHVVATPVGTYGVTMFVTCDYDTCQARLHKHTLSSPPLVQVPTTPTNLTVQ